MTKVEISVTVKGLNLIYMKWWNRIKPCEHTEGGGVLDTRTRHNAHGESTLREDTCAYASRLQAEGLTIPRCT